MMFILCFVCLCKNGDIDPCLESFKDSGTNYQGNGKLHPYVQMLWDLPARFD